MGILILCLVMIILAVVLGQRTKTNIGLWALVASYIFGTFILKIKPSDLISKWPTDIFVLIFSVTLFYSFAINNGTLEKFAQTAVYKVRKIPWAIPIMLFLIGFVISAVGAGSAANVMMIPIAVSIAELTGMSYFLASIAVLAGINPGGLSPISTIGVFVRRLAQDIGGYSPEAANAFGNEALIHGTLVFLVVFIIAYFVFKGYKLQVADIKKPEPFTDKQKISLALIIGFILVLLVPSILNSLIPNVPAIQFLASNINISFVAIIGSLISLLLKVTDEKKAISSVPWGVLILLSGMGMLISVATESGAIELLSSYVSNSVSYTLVPIMLAVFAGVLSLFVSGFVVNMTFFPLVPTIAAALGHNPGLLFSAIIVGGLCTCISPFSSAGGLVVASINNEDVRTRIFRFLLIWPIINMIIYSIILLIAM